MVPYFWSPACLVSPCAVGVTCVLRRPLRCWRHLPTTSTPTLSSSPACASPPSFSCLSASFPPPLLVSPACLIAPTLGRLPDSWSFLGAGDSCRLLQVSFGMRRRSSMGRRRPFRLRRNVGGATRWPPHAPYFSPQKRGRGHVRQQRRCVCVRWTCVQAPAFSEQVAVVVRTKKTKPGTRVRYSVRISQKYSNRI